MPILFTSRFASIAGASLSLLSIFGAYAESTSPGAFPIAFNSNGETESFRFREGGENLIVQERPGAGFTLRSRDTEPTRLNRVEVLGDILTVSNAGKLPRVTLKLSTQAEYIAIRIVRIEGIPSSREFSLQFEMNVRGSMNVIPLDYMTEASAAAQDTGTAITVNWKHIWNRHPENPLGGFALYPAADEATEDESLLHIWVNEGLPHPDTGAPWTLDAARTWIKEWLARYSDQTRFWISARTPEDLYAAVPFAERSGAREVYLFTDTWRGGDSEPFFPVRKTNWSVNTKVFPKGEEDLRAFSDFLSARGMHLKLHWVSGGIGYADPRYIANQPDKRLASWGAGTLAMDVSNADTTLLFRPNPGVNVPILIPQDSWYSHYDCPPLLHPWFDGNMMNLDGELVRVGAFEDTDKEVWRLSGCERGIGSTAARSHANAAEVQGLISAYGVNFIPDNDSTLLDEMAGNFAGLLNRCRIANVEYDGAEIHAYNGRMWGFNKFASLLYRKLDHPVTAYSSSGSAPPCHLEYRLHSTRRTTRDRQKGIVGVVLDQPHRDASNVLDANWGLSQMCAHGYTIINVMKPDPLFGIDVKTLRSHGQIDALLDTARNWKRVNQVILPEQREQMRKTLYLADDILAQAGTHEKSATLHVLEKVPGAWHIVPTCVLRRPGDADTVWHDGQEHGAISPHQYLTPGESVTVVNPYPAQKPRLIGRVLPAFEKTSATETAVAGKGEDMRGADKDFDYAKELQKILAGQVSSSNALLQPRANEFRNTGDTQIRDDGDALVIHAENLVDMPRVNEERLPEFSRQLNMVRRRGMGMWITGDNSGAVLVVQIPGGDYAIPINFSDRRYIEIPNAQVAWSMGAWGWRMGNKRPRYEGVDWIKLGFGLLPAKSRATVRIEGLSALHEIPVDLRQPNLHLGDQVLHIDGIIASGQYFTWDGGDTAKIFDANWNLISEVSTSTNDFTAPTGEFSYSFTAEGDAPLPWLEVQLMTRDIPIVVPDPPNGPNAS